jgi:hypothetical protein
MDSSFPPIFSQKKRRSEGFTFKAPMVGNSAIYAKLLNNNNSINSENLDFQNRPSRVFLTIASSPMFEQGATFPTAILVDSLQALPSSLHSTVKILLLIISMSK